MRYEAQPAAVIAGRYRLVRVLGAGGSGRVWLAHDLLLGDVPVALKEIRLPLSPAEDEYARQLERAQREARNAQQLREHPNIVTVYDFLVEDEVPWIVMQFIAGHSLHEALADGPLPVATVKRVAAALLDALEAAHAKQIVHRDIKPANVLLADDGTVLLTDFGIAHHLPDSGLTMTGMIIGSAEYLAPERARGEDGGTAGDLFSLGVTLYHAVEGTSPFRRDSALGSLHAVLSDEAPAPRRAEWLEPLIIRLLAKNPDKRPSIRKARALLNEPTTVVLPPASPTAVLPTSAPAADKPRKPKAAGPKPQGPKPSVAPAAPPARASAWPGRLLGLAVVVAIAAWLYHGNQGFAVFMTDQLGLSGDASSARHGDCLHRDPAHGWVEVPCFSAAAERTVLDALPASGTAAACTTAAGWDSSHDTAIRPGADGHGVQLCTAPTGQAAAVADHTPTAVPSRYVPPTFAPRPTPRRRTSPRPTPRPRTRLPPTPRRRTTRRRTRPLPRARPSTPARSTARRPTRPH
ncbi:serine/threonine-protein kinase [Kitasatospora mediocidica]|uniref:serine/threonine-protein kinase n=1 Tax=Kitasatospora mediocidica TaxID=58352 RepID=UPI00068BFB5D|nr:serine/threonine-protein kinase [Kitasatospora mediocidica]